jgi:hypothetical protein
MLELISRDDAIIIEINDLKPILNAGLGGLILLREYKPHKITKPHPLAILLELPRTLREYPLNGLPGKRISRILRELLLGQEEVMIAIQLPEFDVDDVEVFVAEEVPVFVDVVLVLDIQ